MFGEFKKFAMRGNVIDLAVGVVIGAAFSSIVASLVGDIIMPIIGIVTGGVNFSGLSYTFGSSVITYGKFIQATFNFLIVAFALFLFVKAINVMKRKEKEAPTAPAEKPEDVKLLAEIRDLLRKKA
ncbi:MAG: large-conductance mechanosensitive channel protein MscL [Candidatus Pacebacteria bacterium]|nr:large-conductance mechanosensitive channel protein MscL [Candidatus Paceibacterota bacterium]